MTGLTDVLATSSSRGSRAGIVSAGGVSGLVGLLALVLIRPGCGMPS